MNQQAIEIRETTLSDIPALRKMHAQSWRDTYPNEEEGVSKEWVKERTAKWLTSEGLQRSREFSKGIYGSLQHLHKIALQDGRVVGIVHGSKTERGQHLEALYIDKEFYGSGLAGLLMGQVMVWFDPAQPVDLEVATYNERAKAFYRKYGFAEKIGSEHLFAEKIPVVVMERKDETRRKSFVSSKHKHMEEN